MKPASETLLQAKIRTILQDSDRIYPLYKAKSHENYDSILKFYDLMIANGDSLELYTRFDRDLSLLPVARENVE